MRFAQDNHVVNALATNRSDQSFGEAVLPRRAWGIGDAAKAAMRREVHRFVWLHCRTYRASRNSANSNCSVTASMLPPRSAASINSSLARIQELRS